MCAHDATEPCDVLRELDSGMTRAGIVTVAGKPNAGKSTLLNRIIRQKLAITSPKPQSTRDRVVGIRTEGEVQMIVFDTPGLLEPKYQLQESMRSTALNALSEADVIVYLADAGAGIPPPLEEAAGLKLPPSAPVIEVLNKSDILSPSRIQELAGARPDAVFTSAKTGDGVEELFTRIASHLPESPFLYPDDDVSTQSVRFFVSEMIRETVLEQLHDEVPYSVAVGIEEFREGKSPVYIRAVIYVERESQKRIIIGAKGSRIREVGQSARKKIEGFLGQSVYLDMWVKVLPNWRRSSSALERLGYHLGKEQRP
jgi:GTP-binding protein Era